MNECLTEILVIMVSGEGENGSATLQERPKHILPVTDRFPETIGASEFAEQIARDEQNINTFSLAVAGDTFHGKTKVGRSIDATKSVAKVPVGCVENFHTQVLCRALRW
jgi:hypothetical protein